MSNFFELIPARPTVMPQSAVVLRTEPSAKYISGQRAMVGNVPNAATNPTGFGFATFQWDSASLSTDDGVWTIKPNDIAPLAPGRFKRLETDANKRPYQTLFVDRDARTPTPDGSFGNPFTLIQAAINATVAPLVGQENVWEIVVAPAYYDEDLAIPPDRQIIIMPRSAGNYGEPPVVLGVPGGPFRTVTWTTSGGAAGITPQLDLRGIFANALAFVNTVPAAVAPACYLTACQFLAPVSDGGTGMTGSLLVRRSLLIGGISCPGVFFTFDTERAVLAGAVSVGNWSDIGSQCAGGIALTITGTTAGFTQFTDTDFTGFSGGAASLTYPIGLTPKFFGRALRTAAKQGLLPFPAALAGAHLYDADGIYYAWQHSVRGVPLTVNTALTLADDYVPCDPAAATTITVTLPDSYLFAGLIVGPETIGAVVRLPARTITIKNIGTNAGSVVQVAGIVAGQTVDGQTRLALLPGESVTLTPAIFLGGAYQWHSTSNNFGKDYQTANSAAASISVSAVFASKVALTTPVLYGNYMVRWTAVLSTSVAATDCEAQLFDATAAVQLGGTVYANTDAAADRMFAGGQALVAFAGVAKTLQVRWRRPVGAGNAIIDNATVEIWRV